jgi:hypothetical protein
MPLRRRAVFVRLAFAMVTILSGCTPPAPPPSALPAPPPLSRSAVVTPSEPPIQATAPSPRHAGFRQVSILFYQPDAVLKARLGPDEAKLTGYIRHVDRAAEAALAKTTAPGFQAALVIALKPGGTSRAWLVSKAKIAPDRRDDLTAAAESVPPPSVQGGPVALAIVFNAYGGGGKPVVDAAHPIPIPPEWRGKIPQSTLPQGPGPAALSQ